MSLLISVPTLALAFLVVAFVVIFRDGRRNKDRVPPPQKPLTFSFFVLFSILFFLINIAVSAVVIVDYAQWIIYLQGPRRVTRAGEPIFGIAIFLGIPLVVVLSVLGHLFVAFQTSTRLRVWLRRSHRLFWIVGLCLIASLALHEVVGILWHQYQQRWHSFWQPARRDFHEKGKLVKTVFWFPNGSKQREKIYLPQKTVDTYWYMNGKKQEEKICKLVPIYTCVRSQWNASGQKIFERIHHPDQYEKKETYWWPHGVKQRDVFCDKKRKCRETSWHTNGKKWTESFYALYGVISETHGTYTEWYNNGQKKQTKTYDQKKRRYLFHEWNRAGHERKRIEINFEAEWKKTHVWESDHSIEERCDFKDNCTKLTCRERDGFCQQTTYKKKRY